MVFYESGEGERMMLSSIRYFLGSVSAAGMLTGCVSALPTATTPSAQIQERPAIGAPAGQAHSWMDPSAKHDDLLYIGVDKGVEVYSYPEGQLTGKLGGISSPWGLCADNGGHVFVPDGPGAKIREYEHGGSSPIAILKTPNESPWFCAVDPTTGNLAVTELDTKGYRIAIYTDAKGKPKTYSGGIDFWSCSYDNKGDLFVDGTDPADGRLVELEVLHPGNTSFTMLNLSHDIEYLGSLQWDGKYLNIASQGFEPYPPTIYRFSVIGDRMTSVGSTPLNGTRYVGQFWIQGSKVIVPSQGSRSVLSYGYPTGGAPTKFVTHVFRPFGAVVSRASN
jgi:hypothetical protein